MILHEKEANQLDVSSQVEKFCILQKAKEHQKIDSRSAKLVMQEESRIQAVLSMDGSAKRKSDALEGSDAFAVSLEKTRTT